MATVSIDKSLKTISNGMRYFTNIYQLLVLAAVFQLVSGVMAIRAGRADNIENSILEFISAAGYAIVAVGFYYLRTLFGAVRNVVDELRTTV